MNNRNLLLFLVSVSTFAMVAFTPKTTIKKELICKTWRLIKYQEADGKVYPAPEETANDYLKYNCDGTFESIEMGIKLKGKWSFDDKTALLVSTQTMNKNFPSTIRVTVITLSDSTLITKGKDAGGATITLYMKSM